jgi:aminoglycoside phosphotransferase (APT) family kinase protein
MDAYTGTKPVADQHSFDSAALQAYLEANLEASKARSRSSSSRAGSEPDLQAQHARRLLRDARQARPGGQAAAVGHAIDREFTVMRALHTTDVPVPRMLVLCEDEGVIGRAFYVMEFMQGRVLWDQSLPDMDKAGRAAIYDEMNRVIAALHNVDVKAAGLESYGKPGNYFDRSIGRWSKQYIASITEPIAEMDRLMEWLPAHMPASGRDDSQASVVHGDFRLDNLVFHPTEPRVLAVLDWELSTIGHPLADFSYHCMSWHIPASLSRGIGGLDLEALASPTKKATCAATASAPAAPTRSA